MEDEAPEIDYRGVLGRYALYGEIAAGGMATVHYGRLLGSVGFSRTVAIKRLHPHLELRPQPLPAADEWAAARDRAEHVLGLSADQLGGRSSIDSTWHCVRADGSDWPGDTHPAMEAIATAGGNPNSRRAASSASAWPAGSHRISACTVGNSASAATIT